MPDGVRKSSEELIREANSRLQSPQTEPDPVIGGPSFDEPAETHSPPEQVEYRSGRHTTVTEPVEPIEPRTARGSRSLGRWVIWGVIALVTVGWGFITSLDDASRDDTGEIVGGGDLDVFTLQVGDCFNDPEVLEDVVFDVAAVPCTAPHDNEVFSLQSVAGVYGDAFPGLESLDSHSYEVCSGGLFDTYVGTPYLDSALEVFTLTPTEDSWAEGDREIVCVLYRLDLTQLTGSARDSGL